jgi:hypothetical protein
MDDEMKMQIEPQEANEGLSRQSQVFAMATHRVVGAFACFTAAVFFLLGSSTRLSRADAARPIRSLTVAERTNLPDNTQVTLSGRGTVTLGQLRAEHRARLERFSRAGVWGKRLADRMPKPAPLTGAAINAQSVLVNSQPPAGNNVVSNGILQPQNSSALGQDGSGNGRGIQNTPGLCGVTNPGEAGQQQNPNGGVLLQGNGQNALDGKAGATLAGRTQKQSSGTGGGIQNNQATNAVAATKKTGGTGASGLGGSPSNGGGVTIQGNGQNTIGAGINQVQSNGAIGEPGCINPPDDAALHLQGNGQNTLRGGNQISNGALGQTGGSNGGGGVGGRVLVNTKQAPPTPGAGKNAVAAANAASSSLFLVPRQGYKNDPLPVDYVAFCNAAQASACIYLPPNTTFAYPGSGNPLQGFQSINQTLHGNVDSFALDIDPLITDAGACNSLGGTLMDEGCRFVYFTIQETKFKPSGTPSTAASCDPGSYSIDLKQGTIDANYAVAEPAFATGATPVTCVVQVWLYPFAPSPTPVPTANKAPKP